MAHAVTNDSPTYCCRTICLPFRKDNYDHAIADPIRFRQALQRFFQDSPELFPEGFAHGFHLVDSRTSAKLGLTVRRIQLRDGTRFTIRPAFVMPYMTAYTDDVEDPLFLRKFGVPLWALARVFGRNPMFWFRLQCALGRNSLVGTTLRHAEVPPHLLADEHHQTQDGDKVYVATTVGGGCLLGVAVAESASANDLTAAYRVFANEARNVCPHYKPSTVNTDGWKSTHAAWLTLFAQVVVVRCFLHAWLKIRERAKHLGETFGELSRRVWEAYHAPNKRSLAQRLRSLRGWAATAVSGLTQQAVNDLCAKSSLWQRAYEHPGCYRTSAMLDRLMRPMHRYLFDGQHLHGKTATNENHLRGWALLCNFTPWHAVTAHKHQGWRSPAEQLNQHRYHDSWLQSLLTSASLGGYRIRPPQNP